MLLIVLLVEPAIDIVLLHVTLDVILEDTLGVKLDVALILVVMDGELVLVIDAVPDGLFKLIILALDDAVVLNVADPLASALMVVVAD